MILLFGSSIVGGILLLVIYGVGILAKIAGFLSGCLPDVQSSWQFDSLHLQIGMATVLGGGMFVFLVSQFLEETHDSEEEEALSSKHTDKKDLIELD